MFDEWEKAKQIFDDLAQVLERTDKRVRRVQKLNREHWQTIQAQKRKIEQLEAQWAHRYGTGALKWRLPKEGVSK